jgi:hypothetical protein
VYPIDDDDNGRMRNLNYGIGLILWQMSRSLRKGLLSDTPSVDSDKFLELTGCKLPTTSAAFNEEDHFPSFGPFPGECELKALNRCLCLFAHIKFATTKSQWGRRFMGQLAWDASITISKDYVPD